MTSLATQLPHAIVDEEYKKLFKQIITDLAATTTGVATVVGSTYVTVDSTDPLHPVVANGGVCTLAAADSSIVVGGTAHAPTVALGHVILPTSDPAVAGALWNNAGTVTISAG